MPASEQSIGGGIQRNALRGRRAAMKLPLSGRLVVTRKFLEMPYTSSAVFAKTPPKIDHRLLGPFLPGLDDRIPAAFAQFSTEGSTQWRIFQPSVYTTPQRQAN